MNDQKRTEVLRLDTVPLREVWRHEAYDFSRWLAENLDRLSEALGVELERIATEHPVGRYSLDILAGLPGGEGPGELVVIENQLAQSDHDHLGKCLTYAAGVGASTVVWITPSLNPEHRAAIEWLNQNTHDGIRFFVVEPRAVRIVDSPPALVLDVVVRPNDWQKAQRERATAASAKLETFQEFLDEFIAAGREDLVPMLEEIKKWTTTMARRATAFRRLPGIPSGRTRSAPSGPEGSTAPRPPHTLEVDSWSTSATSLAERPSIASRCGANSVICF